MNTKVVLDSGSNVVSQMLVEEWVDNDGLHPNMAGYQAMADAVPLGVLGECARRR